MWPGMVSVHSRGRYYCNSGFCWWIVLRYNMHMAFSNNYKMYQINLEASTGQTWRCPPSKHVYYDQAPSKRWQGGQKDTASSHHRCNELCKHRWLFAIHIFQSRIVFSCFIHMDADWLPLKNAAVCLSGPERCAVMCCDAVTPPSSWSLTVLQPPACARVGGQIW